MVRGRDLRAVNVAKAVRQSLSAFRGNERGRPATPKWLKAIESIPPSELLTRPVPVQHQKVASKSRSPKNIFKPQNIVYPEDKLRQEFYRDHPWELARPRVILEVDGKDSWYCDWSKGIAQRGIPLTGESVVQRQMWLMNNEHLSRERVDPSDSESPKELVMMGPLSKNAAYDKARREFYELRQEEEIERRIAREEAMMVGAYFGKNALQVGADLEDHEYERWKAWAAKRHKAGEAARAAAYTSYGSTTTEEVDAADIEVAIDETATPA
ncbi:37S ribosomal protein S25 [Gaeumannomyces tritici R3-111a-1]|uniref:Small ribosomal subunit protein mS23 n=1 Tax=Gaeumannomyces tritici (strain R3-111a-1) TaxID=644352 RepID=J3NTA5_GAET3|nr:37S ribosomal protein S25 [Gaeumannomyces tritici R3-111a-1]EJT79420.1 37S ribosomal protein S25 [Gaeumannomyces tritici R3-111a-1]